MLYFLHCNSPPLAVLHSFSFSSSLSKLTQLNSRSLRLAYITCCALLLLLPLAQLSLLLTCSQEMSKIFRSHKVSFHSRRTLSRPLVMSPSEATALLPSIENGTEQSDPTWLESYKWFFFSSYFNVLLVFVPLSALAHYLNWDVSLRFGFSFLAIVPLAKVLFCQRMMELCLRHLYLCL